MKPEDRLPCREAELAQARYEKAEAERDKVIARVEELEAAIRRHCCVWCGAREDGCCHNMRECPLYPYRGGE